MQNGYENLWCYILLSGIVYHRRGGELWMAPTAEPGCAATAAAPRPLKLPSPGSAGSMAHLQCSWQAVVLKASILQLPGKPDCLDWSWL